MAQGIQPYTNGLPAKYGDSKNTPLTCNVTGKTHVEFKLTTK
jgi:hypothetical protein